ncbi:acetolactate synthase small subunit [Salmonella sp. WGH-01]|nr:acetolactate synthase 1 regulatory subunit [Salmonella enterica subsp. enterica serovar Heidelberg str. RI-11-013312]UQQ17219.1 acetolactate synthase small subunit [Salmonella sp. WGH-01]
MQKQSHDNVILELTVRNHPGVMTHVCGLFARRAFNVEGILCLPIQGSDQSRIWLLVNDDQRLEQMISQIDKLEDVAKVVRNQSDPTMFNKIAVFLSKLFTFRIRRDDFDGTIPTVNGIICR